MVGTFHFPHSKINGGSWQARNFTSSFRTGLSRIRGFIIERIDRQRGMCVGTACSNFRLPPR
jgi:hypothetical protein